MNNDKLVDIDDIDVFDDVTPGSFISEEDIENNEIQSSVGEDTLDDSQEDDLDAYFKELSEEIDDFEDEEVTDEYDDDSEELEEDETIESEGEEEYFELDYDNDILETLQTKDENLVNILKAYSQGDVKGVAEHLINSGLIKVEEEESDFISRLDQISDEDLLSYEAKQKCQGCTNEEIEDLKFKMQQSPAIDKVIKSMREMYKEKEVELYRQKKDQERVAAEKQHLEYNAELNSTLQDLEMISGPFKNSTQLTKQLLPKLKKSSTGETEFVKELLADPVNQYKALFFLENEDLINAHYKKEIDDAYKRGLNEARSTTKVTSRKSKSPSKKSTRPSKSKKDEFISIDDL